ncbi:MAG: DUF3488 and DUF4129 domain-containing transglutaminase family protein, partial [Actinomycetota bacterium]
MGSEAKTRLGLWFVLAVTLFTFGQLFATGDYPGPALLGMLMATGLAILTRRLGFGAVVGYAVSLVVLVWYLGLVFAASKTVASLPTGESLAALGRALARAGEQSRVDYAPIPLRTGYAIAVVAAMWIATTTGEIATFRWRRPLAAVIGPIVIFSFALTVGTGNAAGLHVAFFLSALLTYWGLESAHRLRSWGRWVSAWSHQRSVEPESVTGDLTRRIGAAAVACALVSPVFLPALQEGLLSWRSGLGDGGSGTGGRINPWVSIVPDIPNQSPAQLFTVESDDAGYWRVASLEIFDGEDWQEADRNRVPTEGGVIDNEAIGPTRELDQTVTVRSLEGEFLPAAVAPVAVQRLDVSDEEAFAGIDVDPDSGSILVDDDLSAGDRYRIISGVPDLSYADLRVATPARGDEIDSVYFQMERRLSPEVDDLLDRWTEGARTPFARLVAIQERLRSFEYSLEPETPQGDDLVADFLLRTREGFCQQYATAFALVARHLGYPSRVSVGFLPGEQSEIARRFTVRGTDAHAWPEIYFKEFGWVAFEPTPRGEAPAPGYTLVPAGGPGREGQGGDASGIPELQNPFSDTAPRGEQTEAGGADVDPDLAAGNPRERQLERQRGGLLREAAWQKTFARIVAFTALGVLLFLLAVPGLKELRIRRRYARAAGPDEIAAASFAHLVDEAAELASGRRPSESALAFARRLVADDRVNDRTALRLAEIFEAAAYAPDAITEQQAAEAK